VGYGNEFGQDNPAPMLDAAFLSEVLGNDLRRWGEFGVQNRQLVG
jgi:hypothetical protein